MAKSKIAFVGCVMEGKECLQQIIECGGNVAAILTFTEEMAAVTSGAVSFDDISVEHDIPLYRIKSTNTPETVALLQAIQPDVIFVIGWTRLVSAEVLAIPRLGCIGMHASRLPKYRGRAPVNWAIINNESMTANTMLLLDEGVDTGDILLQKDVSITLSDTCHTVYQKVAAAGKEMIQEIMPFLEAGRLPRKPQNHSEATVMQKRTPEDGIVDWSKSSLELFNWVRALTKPYPGAFTRHNELKLFIWQAQISHLPVLDNEAAEESGRRSRPGEVFSIQDGITIVTGNQELLSIEYLNYEGDEAVSWRTFIAEHRMSVGDILG